MLWHYDLSRALERWDVADKHLLLLTSSSKPSTATFRPPPGTSGGSAFEFLDKMVTVAMPRVRNFDGFRPLEFTRDRVHLRLHDIMTFPEIEAHFDTFTNVAPLDVEVELANCRQVVLTRSYTPL